MQRGYQLKSRLIKRKLVCMMPLLYGMGSIVISHNGTYYFSYLAMYMITAFSLIP